MCMQAVRLFTVLCHFKKKLVSRTVVKWDHYRVNLVLTNKAAIFLLFKKTEMFSAYMLQKQKKAESLGMNRK